MSDKVKGGAKDMAKTMAKNCEEYVVNRVCKLEEENEELSIKYANLMVEHGNLLKQIEKFKETFKKVTKIKGKDYSDDNKTKSRWLDMSCFQNYDSEAYEEIVGFIWEGKEDDGEE